MAERENSVLFSLRELRGIEDDRVKQEEEAVRAKVAADVRAKEDAVRREKEDDERKARDDQERMIRLQHEKERQLREEQLKLEAEKHKTQVDAQARLEETRIQAEIHAKAHAKKAPVGAIVGGVVGTVVLAGAVLGYVLGVYLPSQEKMLEERAARDQTIAVQRAIDKLKSDLDSEYSSKLATAKTEEERKILLAQKAAAEAQQEAAIRSSRTVSHSSRSRPSAGEGAVTAPPKPKKVGETKCKDPNDPLCGTEL